uniref:Uncharacterized protein n=1 Tax=Brassica campestris TaxID=3711 RepID=M4CVP0_BRACM
MSIDKTVPILIDIRLRQTSCRRASTDSAYYPSIDTRVDHARERDYSIGSWADDHYHESFVVETAISQPHAEELHKGFTPEELLNMQERDEEMRQDIARIQTQHAAEATTPTSIDKHLSTSIDDDLKHSNTMKSQPNSYTRAEIDQLIEAIQMELMEIQRYMARRPEASTSINRRNNISTDNHRQTSIDGATNRGRLVPKVTSDMSDTNNHGEEISDDAYATLLRNEFQLESLEERLLKIENETVTMKDKWRRGDEAMRDFTEEAIGNTFEALEKAFALQNEKVAIQNEKTERNITEIVEPKRFLCLVTEDKEMSLSTGARTRMRGEIQACRPYGEPDETHDRQSHANTYD